MKHVVRTTVTIALGCALVWGCRDSVGPESPAITIPEIPHPADDVAVGIFECTAHVGSGTLECERRAPTASAYGPSRIIYGMNQVRLVTTNASYDTTSLIYGFDAALKNVAAWPIGTADGTTAVESKVFYHVLPYATSYHAPYDTGTITVANPDGYGNFSRPNNPYYSYTQILQPQEETPSRPWKLLVPRSVNSFSFGLYVFTRYPGDPTVPSAAPDTVPESVYDSTKVVWDHPSLGTPFLRDIVVVLFRPDATAEERQVAVNRTNGTVIGGRRINGVDGLYLVRVPDNGTTSPLEQALARLDTLPQVVYSGVERVAHPEDLTATVRPTDGPDWKKSDWTTNVDSAFGANWGLEAVAAPKAWSCTVGDPATRLSFADRGFVTDTDITPPQNPAAEWQRAPGDNSTHGSRVASIATARGGNGIGMTGVALRGQSRYYDISRGSTIGRLLGRSEWMTAMGRAMLGQNRVINVSLQTTFIDPVTRAPRSPNPSSTRDIDIARDDAEQLRRIIEWNLPYSNDPLFVVAAGNMGLSSRINGLTWLADPAFAGPLSDRVVVVGAVGRTGAMSPGQAFQWAVFGLPIYQGSNYGPLVTLAAPGLDVAYISPGSTAPQTGSGTSFAAPFVSGAAALLLGMDPRLSAAEVKSLLINGSILGGRTVNNGFSASDPLVPLLNTYEPLRLAAERSGSGLCGNPVWQDTSGAVITKRGASFGGATEQLFMGPKPTAATGLSGQHGTTTVRFSSGAAFGWRAGAWVSMQDASTSNNASMHSRTGVSHDGDTTVTVAKRSGADPTRQELFDIKVNGVVVRTIEGPGIFTPTYNPRCTKWETWGTEWTTGACVSEYNTFSKKIFTSETVVSYNSATNEAYLSVVRDSSAQSVNVLQSYYDAGYYHRDSYFETKTHDTYTYVIPLDATKAVRTYVYPSEAVRRFAFSEGGMYVAMQRSFYARNATYTSRDSFSFASSTCGASYKQVSPNVLAGIFDLPTITGRFRCYEDAGFAS